MRSSAVTMGAILVIPPPDGARAALPVVEDAVVVVVQGSKSYIDVSISANKTSSKAKSERKPDDDRPPPPEGSVGKGSSNRSSACKTPATSGFARCSRESWEVETVGTVPFAANVRVVTRRGETGGVGGEEAGQKVVFSILSM